jgi:hypothetical protein
MVEFTVEEEETTSGSGEVIFHDKSAGDFSHKYLSQQLFFAQMSPKFCRVLHQPS